MLPEGLRLRVRRTANLHQGGTIHDVTAEVNPALCRVAVTAAEAIGIPVTGIDLLVPDVTGDEYVFVEANERPGLANHEPQPTAAAFIDFLFPGRPGLPQAWKPEQPPEPAESPGAGAQHDLGGQLRGGFAARCAGPACRRPGSRRTRSAGWRGPPPARPVNSPARWC